jgi:hypothetical protein
VISSRLRSSRLSALWVAPLHSTENSFLATCAFSVTGPISGLVSGQLQLISEAPVKLHSASEAFFIEVHPHAVAALAKGSERGNAVVATRTTTRERGYL